MSPSRDPPGQSKLHGRGRSHTELCMAPRGFFAFRAIGHWSTPTSPEYLAAAPGAGGSSSPAWPGRSTPSRCDQSPPTAPRSIWRRSAPETQGPTWRSAALAMPTPSGWPQIPPDADEEALNPGTGTAGLDEEVQSASIGVSSGRSGANEGRSEGPLGMAALGFGSG